MLRTDVELGICTGGLGAARVRFPERADLPALHRLLPVRPRRGTCVTLNPSTDREGKEKQDDLSGVEWSERHVTTDAVQVKLEQRDLMNGSLKTQMTEWWLEKINSTVEQYDCTTAACSVLGRTCDKGLCIWL